MNYPKDQKYYEGAPSEQIREGVHNVVKDVKVAIDKDLLGAKKPAWTSSVGTVGHPDNNEHHKILKDIRTGLKDEIIVRPGV
jgi:hypothetical protein